MQKEHRSLHYWGKIAEGHESLGWLGPWREVLEQWIRRFWSGPYRMRSRRNSLLLPWKSCQGTADLL